MNRRIPVNVLTGFLGSGKTTLLRHILASRDFADCAVLINEFGEVGIDHLLVERIDGETLLMPSGCICCTIRGDVAANLRSLLARRDSGELPPFRRVVIETTGLADPTPILATILDDVVIRSHFRPGNTVTTVDAVNGAATLDRHPEAIKQVALADRIPLTKTDLCDESDIRRIEERIARLNPGAARFRAVHGAVTLPFLLEEDAFDPATKAAEVGHWLAPSGKPARNRHAEGTRSFTMTFERAVDWNVFGIWLTLLLQVHGRDVLRVKGILNVGAGRPVVVNGVQHLVHPPLHLDAWPDGDRRSRLVFILRDIAPERVTTSFAAFQQALAAAPLPA